MVPDPSKPSKDNNKKKVKEDIDEVFADPKDVSTALSKTAPKRLPVKKGIPKQKPGESKAAFKKRVLKKEDIDEVSGVPVAKNDDFDPIAASEALDKIAGVDDVEALDIGPVNEKLSDKQSKNMDKDDDGDIDAKDLKALRKSKKKGDVSEQDMPEPELPKVPDVKTEVPAAEKMTPPKAPAGQQTMTPLSLKEQVSAKHNRIFESLVKSVTKK